MEKLHNISQDVRALSVVMKGEFLREVDQKTRSLNLCESPLVRRAIDLYLRSIKIQRIPECLEKNERAVLVSNYFSVGGTTIAVLKAAFCLPGKEMRLRAIARKEVKTKANLLLKALGVDRIVYSAYKDKSGVYKLDKKATTEIVSFLKEPGHVLWMSVTGKTEGNGLLEKDLRIGAAYFSSKSQAPIVPMGVVIKENKGKRRIEEIRFGKPILIPKTKGLDEIEKSNLLIDCTRLTMAEIARLLPRGQRGDFEEADDIVKEIQIRLKTYSS